MLNEFLTQDTRFLNPVPPTPTLPSFILRVGKALLTGLLYLA